MTLFPIVERELRVTARQWRTYWGRTAVGTSALAATLYLIWLAGEMGGPMRGPMLLKIVSYIALAFCIFAGANRTADCISSEKREDTLGLLFLTHLRSPDIVFGKIAASSLHSILFLVSTLPILAIPVMLGGVTGAELISIPISLLNALLFSMSIGILASTICKVQRRAMLASSISMMFLVLFLPLIGLSIKMKWDLPLAATILSLASPIFAHEMSFNAAFGLSRFLFWLSIGIQCGISAGCLLASCLLLPRSWQVKDSQPFGWKARLREWSLGPLESRRKRRAWLLFRNPIFWLGARERFAPATPFIFLAAVLSAVAWGIVHYDLETEPAFFAIFFCLGIIDIQFRVRIANTSAMNFARERQAGTWEMILSTPLTVREIVRGNALAVRRTVARSYLLFLALYALAVCASYRMLPGSTSLLLATMIGVFSLGEFFILPCVGMWRGMAAATPVHAPAQALLRITVLPWMIWLLLLPVFQEVPLLKAVFDEHTMEVFVLTTSVIWVVSVVSALRSTLRNLRLHFRDPASAPSLWRTLRSKFLAFVNLSPSAPARPLEAVLTVRN